MASRIQIAKPDIVKEFSEGPRILRARDVAEVFDQRRAFWRLSKGMSLRSFVQFLIDKTDLREVRYPFPVRSVSGYTWGEVPLLETLLGLVDGAYYSHYTALRIHGLTEQVPKTIYLSRERSSNSALDREVGEIYSQEAITAAFSRPPRISKNEVVLTKEQVRIVMLEGAYQGALGVTSGEVNWGGGRSLKLRYTSLERTMIDAVVRPFYAGGVFEVAKAFENAKERLSGNTLSAMLKRLALGYPYHQAIGYYLERAGYKKSVVDLFHRLPMERDFYLTHDMGAVTYNSRWRLYVPEGF